MGKLSNVLLMVDLLNTGNKYTAKELSKRVGISERMVRYYISEIESAGVYVESFLGPGGGYFIINGCSYHNVINKYDVQLLEKAYVELEKQDFKFKQELLELVNKMQKTFTISEEKSKFINSIFFEKYNETKNKIEEVIKKSGSLKIVYDNISGEEMSRTIHPLQLFTFKDKCYVTAFCELRNTIRHFDMDRIKISKIQ